jgi:hypothetical protein
MNIVVTSCPKTSPAQTAPCPLAEALPQPVESPRGTRPGDARYTIAMVSEEGSAVNDGKETQDPPPAVISGAPQRELERKLKRNPHDQDAKIDVGSDESMDASDPHSAAQPGHNDDPVPSSSFPD